MIIMGLGHHGRLDRLFGGETTIAVIRRARLPVLVVPPRMRSLPRHAVAALDFTEASIASATLAASLLVRGGTLTLAHVCSFAGVKARDGDLVDVYRAGARAKLEEALRAMRRRTSRRVDSVMLEGEPGDALLDYAHRARWPRAGPDGTHRVGKCPDEGRPRCEVFGADRTAQRRVASDEAAVGTSVSASDAGNVRLGSVTNRLHTQSEWMPPSGVSRKCVDEFSRPRPHC
jgi:nucleotide-binding universal stress UspA family protein